MQDLSVRQSFRFPDSFTEISKNEIEQTIHHRFEQQVMKRPKQLAIRFGAEELTYSELNRAANRLAYSLRTRIGNKSAPVGVFLDQGAQLIVWFLAILKAGFIYAPLDRRLPVSMLVAMIDDLDPCAMVVSADNAGLARSVVKDRCPIIDAVMTDDESFEGNLEHTVTANSLAYIFYTSGSTGTPKGVADTHRNVLHNIMRYTNTLGFAPEDRMSMVQHPSFSGTISSLFGALLNGGTILPFNLYRKGLHTLTEWLKEERVTVFHSVPSIFRQLLKTSDYYPDLRLVRLEGDQTTALDIKHFKRICSDPCVLVNGLGATECGLVRQFFIGSDTESLPDYAIQVGYPVQDMAVHIKDEAGNKLPHNKVGEIVIESPFLATGYWKKPQLTNQKFRKSGEHCRCYHTGDLGRLDSDGCLTHLGRLDHQVKIAGDFADVTAIENTLTKMRGISQAVVHDYKDLVNERHLAAYIVTDDVAALTITDIRDYLTKCIPTHMIPTAIVFLNELPLSNDFKTDRRRLPSPERLRPILKNEYVASQNTLEKKLTSIWSDILEIEPVGVTDSYFDLGGDSLRAMQIVVRVNEMLESSISLKSFFDSPTIRDLVRLLSNSKSSTSEFN